MFGFRHKIMPCRWFHIEVPMTFTNFLIEQSSCNYNNLLQAIVVEEQQMYGG